MKPQDNKSKLVVKLPEFDNAVVFYKGRDRGKWHKVKLLQKTEPKNWPGSFDVTYLHPERKFVECPHRIINPNTDFQCIKLLDTGEIFPYVEDTNSTV